MAREREYTKSTASSNGQSVGLRGGLWRVFLILMIVVTVASGIAQIFVYLSCHVNPNTIWIFTFFGLAATFIFLWNGVLLLFWTILWRVWAFIPLSVLLVGIGYAGELVQISFAKQYDVPIPRQAGQLKVLTYNVHGFRQFAVPHAKNSTMGAVGRWIVEQDPDIICLQEFQYYDSREFDFFNHTLENWNYQKFSYIRNTPNHKWGLAVYSRYPLINAKPIRFDYHENSSMMMDVVVGRDTISLFNCHLQTTAYNSVNPNGLAALRDDAEQVIRAVGYSLNENAKIRASQSDSMALLINNSTHHPKIVVGDFNAPPMSYSYNTMRGNMKDSFVDKGHGYEYTYKPLRKIFRIDYILHSRKRLEVISHESPNMPWSDHNPVISVMRLT